MPEVFTNPFTFLSIDKIPAPETIRDGLSAAYHETFTLKTDQIDNGSLGIRIWWHFESPSYSYDITHDLARYEGRVLDTTFCGPLHKIDPTILLLESLGGTTRMPVRHWDLYRRARRNGKIRRILFWLSLPVLAILITHFWGWLALLIYLAILLTLAAILAVLWIRALKNMK